MTRLVLPLSLIAMLVALAGCGGVYDPRAGLTDEVADDEPAVALHCLTEHEGLEATRSGEDEVIIGSGEGAPRVRFFLTGGESEATQFEGKAEGSEQIGSALLFVRDASDDELDKIEFCLDHL